jgi:hypothetical protein
MNTNNSAVTTLDRMIAASPTLRTDASAPVVHLARLLAEQVDASPAGPSTRLAASYLSALKDLRRLATDDPARSRPASRLAHIKDQVREVTS